MVNTWFIQFCSFGLVLKKQEQLHYTTLLSKLFNNFIEGSVLLYKRCIVYLSKVLYCCSILVCWSIHYSLNFCDWFAPPPVPSVSNYNFDKSKQCIGAMTIEIDFLQKKSTDSSPYDSDRMAAEFIQQFNNQAFSVTQQVFTRTDMHLALSLDHWCCLCFDYLPFPPSLSLCLLSATSFLAWW